MEINDKIENWCKEHKLLKSKKKQIKNQNI